MPRPESAHRERRPGAERELGVKKKSSGTLLDKTMSTSSSKSCPTEVTVITKFGPHIIQFSKKFLDSWL